MLYRLEHKSTGEKILSAFSPMPIISMLGSSDSETASEWIVVEYDNPKVIIPNKSWDAIEFYRQSCVE